MHKTIGTLVIFAGIAWAQDGLEKVTVPLQDPARPAKVHAHLMAGGITVKGYDGKDVLVESHSRPGGESRHRQNARSDGMRVLELPGNAGLDVEEDNNEVNIRTESYSRPVDLVISVPRKSSLELKCMNGGDIYVENVDGEIDANNLNGKVTLKDVAGSVLAHSLNGEVLVTLSRIDASKPMSFSTMNGDIDVTLPDNLKANLKMKTDHGEIFSDFEVKLNPAAGTVSTGGREKDGTFHLRFDRTLRGTVNGGGPEFQFTSFNGQIYIRKKK
jgi:hypothetical protein